VGRPIFEYVFREQVAGVVVHGRLRESRIIVKPGALCRKAESLDIDPDLSRIAQDHVVLLAGKETACRCAGIFKPLSRAVHGHAQVVRGGLAFQVRPERIHEDFTMQAMLWLKCEEFDHCRRAPLLPGAWWNFSPRNGDSKSTQEPDGQEWRGRHRGRSQVRHYPEMTGRGRGGLSVESAASSVKGTR
jgi:hypothetical protein